MLKSFYGLDIGEPSGSTGAATDEIVAVFELLKPKASKTPLIRIGGDMDGSYLVPDDLDGIAACFSPGVNRIKYFEDFLTDRYGIQSSRLMLSSPGLTSSHFLRKVCIPGFSGVLSSATSLLKSHMWDWMP